MGACVCHLRDGTAVRFHPLPFARGEYSNCHRGRFCSGASKGSACVVKTKRKRMVNFVDQIKIARLAQQIAKSYNQQPSVKRKIRFVQPQLGKVTTVSCAGALRVGVRKGSDCLVEEYIRGRYEKFVSNNGTMKFSGTLTAFCHFSFWASKQRLLLVDLQGVRIEKPSRSGYAYVLTDPAFHSSESECGRGYGELDLGTVGIESFFSSHKCDKMCRGLPKPARCRYSFQDCERIIKLRKRSAYVARMDEPRFVEFK